MTRRGQEEASVVLVMVCFLTWVLVRGVCPVCEITGMYIYDLCMYAIVK